MNFSLQSVGIKRTGYSRKLRHVYLYSDSVGKFIVYSDGIKKKAAAQMLPDVPSNCKTSLRQLVRMCDNDNFGHMGIGQEVGWEIRYVCLTGLSPQR